MLLLQFETWLEVEISQPYLSNQVVFLYDQKVKKKI